MHQLILITALSATTGLCGGHKKAHCAPTCAPAPVCAPAPAPVCEPAPAPVCETKTKKHCGLKLGGLFKKKHHGCAPACETAPAPTCETAPVVYSPAPVYYSAPVPSAQSSPQVMPAPQAPGKYSR